jgi:hypothetical protein
MPWTRAKSASGCAFFGGLWDYVAQNTSVGLNYYLYELERRASARRERRMLMLTWAIAVLTAVNVVAVLADVL